ncbi:hypothetical protein SYNPS1DRAFT_27279 [Syncephalis pseudoplumigaleata]|uniref:Myb-like domain-containing protein n=2 Tax=Zoopagomycota TaxID=1913638 RepID=A0A4P9ZMR2_9FUNG|nr:hypothetical protein SYNPS1DRAFT_27279 [Syncephalis pseudoplumigaleata]RKP34368.1 hypothetical protein BJ085DRAFT_31858 [Dimargaris cristalligena]|eukprot:RKP27057.1 hypothetical protein SYNPS1DRAFT_27279 [Syncephalis pseudoplumigaleata]
MSDSPSVSPERSNSPPSNTHPSPSSAPASGRRVVRDVNWRDVETFRLLQIKREISEESRRSRFNSNLWALVSYRMREAGYQRTAYQCITRWRRLVQRYHELQRIHQENPQQVQSWTYYREMEEQMDAVERRASVPRRSAVGGRRREGSLSVPSVSPVGTPTSLNFSVPMNNVRSGPSMVIRSPPLARRSARELTNPYILTAPVTDGLPYPPLIDDGRAGNSGDESRGNPQVVGAPLHCRSRGSFSSGQSNQLPPLSSVHPLAPVSNPLRHRSSPLLSGATPSHFPSPLNLSLPRSSRPIGPGPPPPGMHGRPFSPTRPGPHISSPHDPLPRLSMLHEPPNPGPPPPVNTGNIYSTLSSPRPPLPSETLQALNESLNILRDNQQTMTHFHERLLHELHQQRAENNLIRQERKQEFTSYIEELREERRQCHTLISESQERFITFLKDLCLEMSSKLSASRCPTHQHQSPADHSME